MGKYLVTVVMVLPDDVPKKDIKHVAEERLGRQVHRIRWAKRKVKHGRKV